MAAVPYSTLRAVARTRNAPDTRDMLEQHIERMIALLDRLDGDPDREPDVDDELGGDEEPWLASLSGNIPGVMAMGFLRCRPYYLSDAEFAAHEALRRHVIAIPSLSQENWAGGGSTDGEWAVDDEGEATNEDGGDILDEPHDDDFDLEDCHRDFPAELAGLALQSEGDASW